MSLKYESSEDWFHTLASQYTIAQILFHLNQVGVFPYLYRHQAAHTESIAKDLDLNLTVLNYLLDYVYSTDVLLDRDAQGAYSFSEFGKAIIKRFGKEKEGVIQLNFFDVRVGGYEPIWSSLSDILKGDKVYGKDVVRRGEYSESALHVLSQRILPSLSRIVNNYEPKSVCEFGVASTLLVNLGKSRSDLACYGVDYSAKAIADAKAFLSHQERARFTWIEDDLFNSRPWMRQLAKQGNLFFTLHFHEFMSYGRDAVAALVRDLHQRFPGDYLVAFEEPRPRQDESQRMPKAQWLYAHANILIHELCMKGSILPEADWINLFSEAGLELVEILPTGFLLYNAYIFKL